jgi:hypothetical protein
LPESIQFLSQDVGLKTILKNDSELHARVTRSFDQCVCALGTGVDRLLYQHMQSTAGCSDALLCVERRRTADHHHVHRLMGKELLDLVISRTAILLRERRDFV